MTLGQLHKLGDEGSKLLVILPEGREVAVVDALINTRGEVLLKVARPRQRKQVNGKEIEDGKATTHNGAQTTVQD